MPEIRNNWKMVDKKQCVCQEHEGENPLPVSDFGTHNGRIDGLNYYCKKCVAKRSDKWRRLNPESHRISSAKTKAKHYKKNRDLVRATQKEYYQNVKEKKREEYAANVEKYRAAQARTRQKRKENGKMSKAEKDSKANDINYRLSQIARDRRKHAIKAQGGKKLMKHIDTLGCTIDFFKKHIESQFLPGMSWSNHGRGEGKWQIDEIKPCASFDLSDPEQYKACFHYTNAQPLWAIDNMRKSSIYNGVRHINKKAA